MARIGNDTIERWHGMASVTVANAGLCMSDIKRGVDAWSIAHRAGITNEAYAMSRDIVDAHIQTALQKIFPNAVFKDAKRY